ncbi:MAG: class I SAM-dependent methyltransferase, partial [Acidobacteriota bacterium]|nr:class I SAM-dependent methyltransferase [Acidobacteriota bacterium]
GVEVLACDAAPRMIEVARRRLTRLGIENLIELRVMATERIPELEGADPFDGALSNFGGLNCVEDLRPVARDLGRLLRPGATALLCMLGRSAAWEIAWYLAQGKPRKAFRRFQRGGAIGRLADGVTVRVHYPSVRAVARIFAPEFRLLRFKGVGVTVPPTYVEPFARRFPRALQALAQVEAQISGWPVLRNLADHVLFEFQRVTPQV